MKFSLYVKTSRNYKRDGSPKNERCHVCNVGEQMTVIFFEMVSNPSSFDPKIFLKS